MTKTIEVIISPSGETSIETTGFSGDSCREASRFLEQALGSRVSEQLKPEYHQIEVAHQQAQQKL